MKSPRPTTRCFGIESVGRGHAQYDQHLNREPGVFVVAVGEIFSFRPDWHQDDRAAPLVRQYQLTLDSILRDHPGLARCAVPCCHCGIRFLTDPRNAHRRNLRCPFGCRKHHRRQQANERSQRHYQTAQGRRTKKRLNAQRSLPVDQAKESALNAEPRETPRAEEETSSPSLAETSQVVSVAARPTSQVVVEEDAGEEATMVLDSFTLDEATLVNSPLLPYLAMVATVIEGRTIRCQELLGALRRSMRRRSLDRLPRREYVLRFLDQHPP